MVGRLCIYLERDEHKAWWRQIKAWLELAKYYEEIHLKPGEVE